MEPYLNRFLIFFLVQTRTRAEGEEVEGHDHERNYGQHAVVSVGLNEVVSGDGRGVDVMLSEGSYEGLRVRAGHGRNERSGVHLSVNGQFLKKYLVFTLPFQKLAYRRNPMCLPPSGRVLTQSRP